MATNMNHRVARKFIVRAQALESANETVTVVISCFNYARFLNVAVLSALSQEGVSVNVIIVDDASTDESLSVAHRIAAEWPQVTVVSHARNQGPVISFNDGAALATGTFLVRLDADDILTPGSLSRAVAVACRYPSVGLVYGHPLHFSGNKLPQPRLDATKWTVWPGCDWLEDRCRQGRNVITSPEVLMRRGVVEQVGYQVDLAHSHDMEHWMRIAAFSDVAYIRGADQAWHREHDNSLSATEVDSIVDLQQRQLAFDRLFRGKAGQIVGAERLQEVARRSVAWSALSAASHALDANLSREQVFAPYMAHAESIMPEIRLSPSFRRVMIRSNSVSPTVLAKVAAVCRRARFRVVNQWQWRKWHRTGTY